MVDAIIATSIRNVVKNYPLIGVEVEDDIVKGGVISTELCKSVQADVDRFGIFIEDVTIAEAKYAPEIAIHMLVKQQAEAYLSARKILVRGALDTVFDMTRDPKNTLSDKSKEILTVNLMSILVGNSNVQPIIKM